MRTIVLPRGLLPAITAALLLTVATGAITIAQASPQSAAQPSGDNRHKAGGKTTVWTPSASMASARLGHTATSLADGRILVTGGYSGTGFPSYAEVFDQTTERWTPTANMVTPRPFAEAVALKDGRVLVTGGQNASSYLADAETYDYRTNACPRVASMTTIRQQHVMTLLPDG